MASAPSGRYQSRLFNFVHQQSRRLTEQCESAFRHLQVATIWGVQVLLYPVYRLFQSTELTDKQLHSSVQESWHQLPADNTDSQPQTPPNGSLAGEFFFRQLPPADTPIQRVLLFVDALPSEEAVSNPTQTQPLNLLAFLASNALTRFAPLRRFKIFPSPHAPPISPSADTPSRNRLVVRGIATQLSSRTLVMITAQNEILDILTVQQQQKLQERIIGEVANYWHHQRLAHSSEQRFTTQLQLPTDKDSLLPPVRLYRALSFLDRTIAKLESNSLAPVSEVAIALGKRRATPVRLASQMKTAITRWLSGKPQPAGITSPTLAPDGNKAHTLQIQALIRAAIDYFFGRRSGKHLGQTTPTTDSLGLPAGSKPQGKPLPHHRFTSKLPSRHRSLAEDVDPWLTLSDLFGDPTEEGEHSNLHKPESSTSQTTTQQAGKTNLALPSSQDAGYYLRNLLNRFRTFLPQPKQASGRVKRHGSLAKEEFSRQLPPGRVSTGESNQPRNQSTQIVPAPDWIETHATPIGYVKHPLEQFLKWLDRVMLWLEEVLMSILQWLQQLWRGK